MGTEPGEARRSAGTAPRGRPSIENALRVGIEAACRPGVVEITAGNYGGKLGKHHFGLHALLSNEEVHA